MVKFSSNCVNIKSNRDESLWALQYQGKKKKKTYSSCFIYKSKEAATADAGNDFRFQSFISNIYLQIYSGGAMKERNQRLRSLTVRGKNFQTGLNGI